MPESSSDKPKRAKLVGVLLAIVTAVVSVLIVALTHEPKKAVSSPGPARAQIIPQIADAKSEAEILFRGKSFSVMKRAVTFPYTGEIQSIDAKEGQPVSRDDVLVTYKMDRQSLMQVQKILFPETVINLQKSLYERKIGLDKLNTVSLPTKKIELDRAEKDLANVRELASKDMASEELVRTKERHVQVVKKEILEVEQTIKQQEAEIDRLTKDLRYSEERHRRELDLLEWQTHRSYSNESIPQEVAYLKAPIDGQVIWIAPDIQVKSEPNSGFHAVTIAPTSPILVRCKVHELDLVKLKPGDRGVVSFDAIPEKKYTCKISRIPWVSRNPALEVPADYDLECILESPDGKIKDGLTCNVKVSIAQ